MSAAPVAGLLGWMLASGGLTGGAAGCAVRSATRSAQPPSPAAPGDPAPGDAARGAVLASLGSCGACHTAPDGAPYAGGYAIETRFGTFYGPNLTQDTTDGIGAWEYPDFVQAMRTGRAPDGHAYWPAFPYTSFTRLHDADLADLWAFLRTVPPAPGPDRAHELLPRYRGLAGLWQLIAFRPETYETDPERDAVWNRGAYLVSGIGHCGECHSPRDGLGRVRAGEALSGQSAPPEPAPDIAPSGIGDWSERDLVSFFEDGTTPGGDVVGGEMRRIVQEGTAHLTDDERAAIAAYIRSVPLAPGRAAKAPAPRVDDW